MVFYLHMQLYYLKPVTWHVPCEMICNCAINCSKTCALQSEGSVWHIVGELVFVKRIPHTHASFCCFESWWVFFYSYSKNHAVCQCWHAMRLISLFFYFIWCDFFLCSCLRLTAWLLILLMNGLWQRGLLIRLSSYLTYGRSILHFIHLTVTSKHIWGILYYSSRHISVVCIVYEWHSLAAWIHVQISSKLVI
jgi:hypothetical protein